MLQLAGSQLLLLLLLLLLPNSTPREERGNFASRHKLAAG